MSAIIYTFTSDGFVVAADGRTCVDERGEVVDDHTQKIFEISVRGAPFSFSTCGAVDLSDAGHYRIDLATELRKSAERIRQDKFRDLFAYGKELCRPIMEEL